MSGRRPEQIPVPTESEIRQKICAILRDTFSWFDEDAPLVIERLIRQVRVSYAPTPVSRKSPYATFLDCRLDFDSGTMWIGNLQVSVAHRLQGFGRELVLGAEQVAAAMEMGEINLFPLSGSVDFWSKMGYKWKPRVARVLCKNVVVVERELARHDGSRPPHTKEK